MTNVAFARPIASAFVSRRALMDAPSVDYAIQQALARGETSAAARLLVLHHADAVYATCRAMVRDRGLSEDLSQEAFTKALAALPRFRGESQSRTWLLSITRNVCIDHLRRTRGPIDERAEIDVEVQPSETPPPFELLARRGDIERALAPLSEIERAIVVLHHAHGVGYPELAGSFGIAEGTLRMRMSRALTKMREALQEPEMRAAVAPARARSVPTAAPQSAPQYAPMAAPQYAGRSSGRAADDEPASAGAAPMAPSAGSAPFGAAGPSPPSQPAPAPSYSLGAPPPPPTEHAPAKGGPSFAQRIRDWWRGAPPPSSPAPLWPMPDALRERILGQLG